MKSRLEKRALLKVFQRLASMRKEQVPVTIVAHDDFQKEIRSVMRETGLDDKVWIPKIREHFKIGDLRLLKGQDRTKTEGFLSQVDDPAQSLALRLVLSKFVGFDLMQAISTSDPLKLSTHNEDRSATTITSSQSPREERPLTEGAYAIEQSELQKASEVFRTVEGGLLARGIYFGRNFDKFSDERDFVVDVTDDLEFTAPNPVNTIFHHQFNSQKIWEIFDKHIDKHINARSISVGENIWGVTIGKGILESEGQGGHQDENFLSCIHYQMIPVRRIHLKPTNLQLRPEVIRSLQEIERSLQLDNYEPRRHFQQFFNQYGTHVNNGPIDIGGMLKSTAHCRGFREEDRLSVSAAVSKASETALYLNFTNDVRTEVSQNAYEVLGKTFQMCAEDLQNIVVTVQKIGGPDTATDQETWQLGLGEDESLWKVICRNSPPTPIWKIIPRYAAMFADVDKLSKAMLQEWRQESSSTICSLTGEAQHEDFNPHTSHEYKFGPSQQDLMATATVEESRKNKAKEVIRNHKTNVDKL